MPLNLEVEQVQTSLFVLVIVALVPNLLLGAGGIDRLIVQVPGWFRIGPVAFARYARATDLGNGLVLYPVLGISAPLLTLASLVVALVQHASTQVTTLLVVASVLSVLHSITTTQAAPTMMRVGRAGDDEAAIAPLMDRFARISVVRAVLQALTAAVLLWALIAR